MSYVFDVSSEHNDLGEVNNFVLYEGHGDYKDFNRTDGAGHCIFNVEFRDTRYALQFKLKFNATLLEWDESDDEEIVTEEELLERGYKEMNFEVACDKTSDFRDWCKERDYPIVDEIKFIRGNKEPFRLFVPEDQQVLVKLTWAGA